MKAPPPPKYQNSRQCECGRKNLFTVEVVFESVQRMKQSRSFARPFFSCEVWRTCRNDRCRIMKDMSFFVIAWGCIQFCFQRDCLAGQGTHPRRHQKSIFTLFTFTVVSWSFSSPLPCRSIRTDPGFDARLTRPPTHKHARVLADQSAAASRRAFSHYECETTPPKIRSVSASTVCSLSGSTNAGAWSGKK